jgi:putative transposase
VTVHPFIEAEKRAGHSVKRACELLKVSRTAFCARRVARPGPRAVLTPSWRNRSPTSTRDRGEPTAPRASMPCSSGQAPDAADDVSRG